MFAACVQIMNVVLGIITVCVLIWKASEGASRLLGLCTLDCAEVHGQLKEGR